MPEPGLDPIARRGPWGLLGRNRGVADNEDLAQAPVEIERQMSQRSSGRTDCLPHLAVNFPGILAVRDELSGGLNATAGVCRTENH